MPQILVEALAKTYRVAERAPASPARCAASCAGAGARSTPWSTSRSASRRRAAGLHRPQRRRQVHDREDPVGHPAADERPGRGGRPRALRGPRAPCRAHRRGVRPAHPAVVGPAGARWLRSAGRHLPRGTRALSPPTRRARGHAAARAAARPAGAPALARPAHAGEFAAALLHDPQSCSSTSRPSGSMRRPSSPCASSCGGSTASRA